MEIAKEEKEVDYDILVCACLLHDIGRKEQFENPKLCHAMEGAKKAYAFLSKSGFTETFAARVKMCIETHRFREANPPRSIEAKILFDAGKLDAVGVMGIARTLLYKGGVGEPLYRLDSDGNVSDGSEDKLPSFLQEYKYKLEKIYDFICNLGIPPEPVSSRLFPIFFSIRFSVSGFMLRSLILGPWT